jgi:hypothetical protein
VNYLKRDDLGIANEKISQFDSKGFLIVKGFCSEETAGVLAEQLFLLRDIMTPDYGRYTNEVGGVGGPLFSSARCHDAALRFWVAKVSELIKLDVEPINSFARIYCKGSELKKHRDLPILQFGVSICLKRCEKDWPFCIVGSDGIEEEVVQQPGDAIIYRGELLHWRRGSFPGYEHTQLFLHYCDAAHPEVDKIRFRGQKQLSLPNPYSVSTLHRLLRVVSRALPKLMRCRLLNLLTLATGRKFRNTRACEEPK